MDDSLERFHRLVRAPADTEMVITPNKGFLDEVERLGLDPRRPRTALARWVSKSWLEATHEANRNNNETTLHASHSEKEIIERPQPYPADWGIDLIPFPDDLSNGWQRDRLSTACYTSLTTPRPFDPHLHGAMSGAIGFGYHYLGDSSFPDTYDIVGRRGGGPRGGFAMTTGPTEGAHSSAILPQPTFNLGRLGYSNGGWNPEGLQWTNRPKRMSLTGLRNGWAHKVIFARSRRVMNRNLYGQLAIDEATPRAPTVVVNGTQNLHGIQSVGMVRRLNSPTRVNIGINNTAGRRSGTIREGDTIQVFASPRSWANPPLVFTGYVSSIQESNSSIKIEALDALGYLSREVIDVNPSYFQADAATVIKDIIANSAYAPPIGRIINQSFVILPEGMQFVGQTRLTAIQSILSVINSTPNLLSLRTDASGIISMERLREIENASIVPLIAGRVPKTLVPQDFYPIEIERNTGDDQTFNVVKVKNEDLNISVSVPAVGSTRYPTQPNERVVRESFITDANQATLIGEAMLVSQGATNARWSVIGIPERFDIIAGDVMEFASVEGGLSGRHRIFDVSWNLTPDQSDMTLTVGRMSPDILATLRLAAGVSQ
tara:strand:- start:2997 stop:4805 length:1809 start_codon:yes stop_codon:yes gene_type:complete